MYQQNSFFTKKQVLQEVNEILQKGLENMMEDVKKQLEEIVEKDKNTEDALSPEDIEKCLKETKNELQLLLLKKTKEKMKKIRQKNIGNNPPTNPTQSNV